MIRTVQVVVIKGKDTVVRFVPLRCSFLYIIYYSDNSTCVLLEYIISCTVVMLVPMGFRDADTNNKTSVHPSLPLVRRAKNMTIERKARDKCVRLD